MLAPLFVSEDRGINTNAGVPCTNGGIEPLAPFNVNVAYPVLQILGWIAWVTLIDGFRQD